MYTYIQTYIQANIYVYVYIDKGNDYNPRLAKSTIIKIIKMSRKNYELKK